jgi:hypothetical protein
MKRIILIFLFNSLLLVSYAQYLHERYSIFDLNDQTLIFDSSVRSYTKIKGVGNLKENYSVSKLSSNRVLYYLNVILETSKNSSIEKIFDYIPQDSRCHRRLFGNPSVFVEPHGIKYPEPLVDIKEEGITIQSEIMQQNYWRVVNKKDLPNEVIIKMAISRINKDFGRDYILSGYKNSNSHHSMIIKYGRGKYGSSTKVLISKKFDPESEKWIYEVVVSNCTLFTESL